MLEDVDMTMKRTRLAEEDCLKMLQYQMMLHPASGRLGFGAIVPPQMQRQCSGRTWDKIGIGVILLIIVFGAALFYYR